MPSNRVDIKIAANVEGLRGVDKLRQALDELGRIESLKRMRLDVMRSRWAWEEATARVAELAREMRAGAGPATVLNRKFRTAKQRAAALKAEYLRQAEALHKARKAMTEAGVNTSRLAAEEIRLRKAAAGARQELYLSARLGHARGLLDVRPARQVRREIDRLRAAYQRLRRSGKLTAAELYRAQRSLKEKVAALRAETNGWATTLARAKNGFMGLAAGANAVARAFGGYSRYAQKMAEVNTLLDVSRARHAALSRQILAISRRLPQTATELAAAEYDIISAGVALDDSTRVLELSARAAIAGVTDTKTAVNVGLGVINAYGKSINELGDVYDTLFQTVKMGVTTFPELASSIGEVLPTASSAGVSFQEVAASIAALTKANIRTPEAVTALNGAIMAMAAPTPEAKKRFEELGITWKGLIPTLEAIAAKGLSIDQMRRLIPDREASKAVLSLTQNLGSLGKMLEGVDRRAGATAVAFNKMKNTPENQIKLFKNELTALSYGAMKFLASAGLPAIKILRKMIHGFSEADIVAKAFGYTMAGAAAGLALWKLGLDKAVFGLKGMIANLITARAAAGSLSAQLATAGIAMKTALAGTAIFATIEVGRAVRAFIQWRKAAAEAAVAMDRLRQNSARYLDKFSRFADVKIPENITGKAPEEVDELKKKLRGAIAYYTALQNKLWAKSEKRTWYGKLTDEAKAAKKQMVEVGKKIGQYKKALRELYALGKPAPKPEAKQPEEKSKNKPDPEEEKRIRDDRRRLEKQLADDLLEIIDDRWKKALARAKKHYDEQVALAHGNKELLARIEQVYTARMEKIRKERAEAEKQRQAAMARAAARAGLARMEASTRTALEKLQYLYANGQVALEQYFARRRALIEAQHKAETDALQKQAAAETDPVRRQEIETRIFVAEENHRRQMIRLAAEQAEAEKALASNRARAKEMLSDLHQRATGQQGSGLQAEFDRELGEMDRRHAEELERFQQLLDDKLAAELGYQDKAAALRDIAAQQRLEKEKLMADQDRRVERARLETAREVAGELSQLFADYYELSGRKSKEFFYLQKAAAMAEAIIKTQLAAVNALDMQPPWLGMTMAGIIYAQGMARVAMIAAQKLAAGGPVAGYSPTSTADNIPIMATAGEYVQPVPTVRYYGRHVMEALRRRLIPKEFFAGLSLSIPDVPRPAVAFAAGGQVPGPAKTPQPREQQPEIHITNIVDPNLLDQHLASTAGQRMILNVLSANRFQLRQIVMQD